MLTHKQDLEELIDSTVSIPTIPTLLVEINAVVAASDGSTHDAAEIIERDPAIAAKVLRLVNSPFYGLKSAVSSIPLACSILGLKVVRNIVLQATVLDNFGDGPEVGGFDVQELWDHSFKTAMAARMLVQTSDLDLPLSSEDAYTAGLIHDVGKIVLLQGQTERFASALGISNQQQIPLAEAEHQVFGFCHAHVGGMLSRSWKLSEDLQKAVFLHHHDGASEEHLAGQVIAVANDIAHQAVESSSWRGSRVTQQAFTQVGLTTEQIQEICQDVAGAAMA